jgi:hypothetical protein
MRSAIWVLQRSMMPGMPARLQRVGADLVEVAELTRLELRREGCRQEDLALLLGDEFAGFALSAPEHR